MRFLKYWVALLCVTMVWGVAGLSENRPHSYESPVEAGRKMADLHKEEQRLLNELEELDKKLYSIYSQIENLSKQLGNMSKEQAQNKENLKHVEHELEESRKKASARLTALYKFKQLSYAAPLFAIKDFSSAVEAGYIMAKLIAADHRFFLRHRNKMAQVRSLETTLHANEEELKVLKARLNAQQQQLLITKDKEIELLVKIRQKKKAYLQYAHAPDQPDLVGENPILDMAIVEHPFEFSQGAKEKSLPLEEETRRESLALPYEVNKASPQKPFSLLRGALPLPTTGTITKSVESKTGSPYGAILYNNGILIDAPKGQPVKAIHEGVVVFADWFKNYGKVMIIDHGEHYHSLIAHADQLFKKAGEEVASGETIATVGQTGSSERPTLYFEIRHHGQPVDPIQWLAVHKFTKKRGS